MSSLATQPARASGKFAIGGDLPVVRLGYGAMQIPGPGVWGDPRDHNEVIRVLRRAVELGVTLIDTADSYGPEVSERLIREALHPYRDELVIATKAGLTRPGPGRWERNGKPEYLKAQAEKSLRLLGLERIELFQLHRIDPNVPLSDQLGALVELQAEGKIGRIGLSQVSVHEIEAARAITPIATVQNRYNLSERGGEPVLAYCQREGIGWPSYLATHSTKQTLYFDADGLLARHDYDVEISGGTSAAHYVSDYDEVAGIRLPTKHRSFLRTPDGHSLAEPLVVSIDLSEIAFT